ncbi:hypothetical protein [Streptomyces sp. NPDC002644]
MQGFETIELQVLYDALHEHMDILKHYPFEFTDEEAEATRSLYGKVSIELQMRGSDGSNVE